MVQRWAFHDPATAESWTFPVNPNRMTTPHALRNLTVVPVAPTTDPVIQARGGVARVIEGNLEPFEWTVSGYIREQDHYAQLLYWSRKVTRLELTDHFSRTWLVRVIQFNPDEKKPTARRAWRYDYDLKLLNYGVSA